MALPKLVLFSSLPPSGARDVTWAQWQKAMQKSTGNFMSDILADMKRLYELLPTTATFDQSVVAQIGRDPLIERLRGNFRWLPITFRPISMGVDDLVIIAINFAEAQYLIDPTPAQIVLQQHLRDCEAPSTTDASLTRLGQIRRVLTQQRRQTV